MAALKKISRRLAGLPIGKKRGFFSPDGNKLLVLRSRYTRQYRQETRSSKAMRESVPTEQDVLGRIRLEMEKYLHENEAPEDVHYFLIHHWARLMTSIFMAKGNQDADWNSGWDAVNTLLWSLSPKYGRLETEKMLRMLPAILARLHEGCAALAIPSLEKDMFFERLAMMHAAVARTGLKYREDQDHNPTGIGRASDGDARPDLAGLVSSTPTDKSTLASHRQDLTFHPGLPDLKLGDRVRFTLGKEDRVLNLNWVSPAGGMFMFANDQGLDALTLTRARLAERFQAGAARLA
jgi:hypothetical protein